MRTTYQILDEPTPSAWARFTVDPFWIFFGAMLAGGWLAWPWFVLNAIAIGSATRRREIGFVLAGVVGAVILAVAVAFSLGLGLLSKSALPYAMIAFPVWRLLVAYKLHALQASSFELHQYFSRPVFNGGVVVMVGAFLVRPRLVEGIYAVNDGWWDLLLLGLVL
ncbi:MAG: hypothetical protein WBV82_32865 [Myxococcaceae bacterium]